MSRESDLLKRAEEAATAYGTVSGLELRQSARTSITHPAWISALASAATGVLVYLITNAWKTWHWGLLAAAATLAVAFVVILRNQIKAAERVSQAIRLSPPELYLHLRSLTSDLEAAHSEAKALIAWAAIQSNANQSVLGFAASNQAIAGLAEAATAEDFNRVEQNLQTRFATALSQYIQPLEAQRGILLHFTDTGAIYFFEIFELVGSELRSLACRASPDVTRHHRTWHIGDGHVGRAVQIGKPFLVEDLEEQIELHQNRRETDSKYFRSTIAAPIGAGDNRPHKAHGALCVTSSAPKQFAKIHVTLVANLTQPLAALFYSRDFALRRISHAREAAGL